MTPADVTAPVKVAFDVENIGDKPLSPVAFKKTATRNLTGAVGCVQWRKPAKCSRV